MDCPKSYKNIITGRSTLEKWLNNHYNEFYNYLIEKYDNCTIKEALYMHYNNIDSIPLCKTCGKPVKFHGYEYGFGEFCCPKCAQNNKEVKQKLHNTNVTKYGEDYKDIFIKKSCNTKIEKYGSKGYNNIEKYKRTCLERYGVENPMKLKEFQTKSEQTCLKKYGNKYYLLSDEYCEKKEQHLEKAKQTNWKKYGVENPMQNEQVKLKASETCLEQYGVKYNCLRPEAHNTRNSNSFPNIRFKYLLEENDIAYQREIYLGGRLFDFLIGDTFVEINPYSTHNINWNPFGGKLMGIDYHFNKTQVAKDNNYKIINIWDWDDLDKIVKSLLPKKNIYARKCNIKIIKKKELDEFLNKYHFQNTCKNQTIRLGLYYNNELIQVMTFGKPRYNKKYQYELLRLCTKFEYNIIGGSNKLFSFFIKNYNPQNIISYCDNSKFTGNVYNKLGFQLKNKGVPSRHWYNGKTCVHVTDNLLRQRGFDQLFNTSYGKNSSNEKLMRSHGFVEIYDAGQSSWDWCK